MTAAEYLRSLGPVCLRCGLPATREFSPDLDEKLRSIALARWRDVRHLANARPTSWNPTGRGDW